MTPATAARHLSWGDAVDAEDVARVATRLGARVEVLGRATAGASNVTWFVRVDGERAVLRHPPRDRAALPTAHDLAREATVLRALESSAVPVPRVLAVCDDVTVLGVPFVVVAHRDGSCLADADAHVPGLDPRAVAHGAVDALVALHATDPDLLDARRDGRGYLARQIDRWAEQLGRTPTAARLGDLAPIVAWLHDARPGDEGRAIVHGDYGFHNLLVSAGRVEAVLDWELATVGDPVADVFSFLKSWGPDARTPNPANERVWRMPGAPTRAELLARYAAASGRDVTTHEAFYEAFGVWRSVGIFEGIHARTAGARFAAETPQLVARLRAMMSAAPDPR